MKILLTITAIFSSAAVFSQTAEELNSQSKALLSKGDVKNGVPLLQKAAEKGSAEAQYNVGICYQRGVEVIKSDSIANTWFYKSAVQGFKDAQYKLAYSYAAGRGIQQDYQQAFHWSLQCAEQDDPDCMFNVVTCYQEGSGTTKNMDSMLHWAIRLGSLQNPENLQLSGKITSARINLAIMYREGNNVKKDLVKSYTWLLLYNESKQDFSVLVQEQNIELVKQVEKQLTAAQKEAAKREAESIIKHELINVKNLYKADI